MNKTQNTSRWFSIIEVLIGIFVFSLGLVSIYALLASSLRINDYNNNSIIASNLAREQIELFRNIRDTNYKKLQVWDQVNPQTWSSSDRFSADTYYTLENNLSTGNIDVQDLWSTITESETDIITMRWEYGLCLDSTNAYTHDCNWWNTTTPFLRYLHITELEPGSYKVLSKVIWYKRGYHEYELRTIITDWRRI